jgi:hypothetical protein
MGVYGKSTSTSGGANVGDAAFPEVAQPAGDLACGNLDDDWAGAGGVH